jgi:hypothetical protein
MFRSISLAVLSSFCLFFGASPARSEPDPGPVDYVSSILDEATRRPVEGVAVECRYAEGGRAVSLRTTTDAEGKYAFRVRG